MTGVDDVRRQYARNAESLRRLLDAAREVAPRKYRGYTVAQLAERVEEYTRLAAGTDAELLARWERLQEVTR